jgi:hypothetical protein
MSQKFSRVEIWSDCGNENQRLWVGFYNVTKEEARDEFLNFLDGRRIKFKQHFLLLGYYSDPRTAPTTIDEFVGGV